MTPSQVFSLADVTSETVAGLWAKAYGNLSSDEIGRSMLVCKSFSKFLPPLIKLISCSVPSLTRQSFEKFARTYRNLESLSIQQSYNPNLEGLHWTAFSFPHLESLSLHCCPMAHIVFNKTNTPSLKSLNIRNDQTVGRFELDLPDLESLVLEHVHVRDGAQFGKSLSACPKLKKVCSEKLLGLGGNKQVLHLPNCTYIELYHADDLDWLEIHAPKLCNLNLGSCYTLKHLRLHPQEGSPCTVYLVDEVGQQPLQHLQQHPRVGSECICFQNEIDGDDDAERFNEVHGGYPAPHMGGTDELMVANLFQTVVGHYIAEVDDDVYPHERERLWVTS